MARKKKVTTAGNVGDIEMFVSAVEEIDRQKDELSEERKTIFNQAKDEGIDKSILQKVIMRRRKDRAEVLEADALLALYEHRLGMDALA